MPVRSAKVKSGKNKGKYRAVESKTGKPVSGKAGKPRSKAKTKAYVSARNLNVLRAQGRDV